MGQVLPGSATTTAAVRRAIQHSRESMRVLGRRHGINPKTIAKWEKRESTADRRTGPTVRRSAVLSVEQEAIIVSFRKHTLLPLDDCLYALQATIPQLIRSSLHRCLERHGISRLPEVEGDKPRRKKFDTYPAIWNSQRSQIASAARALFTIYSNNVFSSMNVRWGTHPNNIGHNDSPGCFRCHDGNHSSNAGGATITNGCSVCHNLVMSDELHPKLLTDLGFQ